MTKLVTTLLASSLLLSGCFGEKQPTNTTDAATLQSIAAKCSELSGYTGQAAHADFAGITYVFRADNQSVAECEWTSVDDVKLIELLY